jgi:hypothetical protein
LHNVLRFLKLCTEGAWSCFEWTETCSTGVNTLKFCVCDCTLRLYFSPINGQSWMNHNYKGRVMISRIRNSSMSGSVVEYRLVQQTCDAYSVNIAVGRGKIANMETKYSRWPPNRESIKLL